MGLACAREMAMQGKEVVVVEKEAAVGTGTSARNSEGATPLPLIDRVLSFLAASR